MTDPAQELREVLAIPATVTVGGKDLRVRSLLFGEWPDAIERLAPSVEKAFSQALDLGLWFQKSGLIKEGERIRLDGKTTVALLIRLVPMVGTLPDALRFLQWLAATCTGEKLEFVQQLAGDEGVKLCSKVVEINADFFVRRLWPILAAQLARVPGLPQNESGSVASNAPAGSPTSSSA